jgi:DNA polymerase elongation subunit (family B)
MTLTFHILDSIARDQVVLKEDDNVCEIAYECADEYDEDDEFETRGGRGSGGNLTGERKEMILHLFGKTAEGTPIRCDVTGFKPFFFIQLPSKMLSHRNEAIRLIQTYIGQYSNIKSGEYTLDYEERKLFYGYTAATPMPFLRISTTSLTHFRALKNLFLDKQSQPATKQRLMGPFKGAAPKVYEANLDPMLRFFHLQNIQPCGWVTVDNYVETDENGSSIEVEWTDISPTAAPVATAPFKVASWDIECYSSTGDFPLAKHTYKSIAKQVAKPSAVAASPIETIMEILYERKTYKTKAPLPPRDVTAKWLASAAAAIQDCVGNEEAMTTVLENVLGKRLPLAGDPVIQIGTVMTTQGKRDADRHIFVFPSCATVDGTVVHEYPTESAMILGWAAWMLEQDPDILVGYNVFGFDEKYLWERAAELGIHMSEELQQLNRLAADGSSELKCEEKFLSSAALGDNFLYIWTTLGRLQVDLYHYIRRNAQLPSYKLDSVAKVYMSGAVTNTAVSDRSLACTVKGNLADIRPGRYVSLLDDIGEAVLDKLVVVSVAGQQLTLQLGEGDVTDDLHMVTKWAMVKDDVSPQDIFRLHRGDAADRARIAAYCIQDCDLVMDLYRKLDVFNTSMSMANVCSVPIGYTMTRGQGIKIESLIFKETYRRGQTIMVLPSPNRSGTEDSYEGAIVLDPSDTGLLGSPVGVADFASLYPSTIISENISHDTLLWAKDYDNEGRFIGFAWGAENAYAKAGLPCTDIEFDILKSDPADGRKHPRKIRVGKRICRYAQDAKGSLPEIIEGLLAARKAKRREAAAETDPLRCALLDAEQNAYKITANSLYGQLGSGTFKVRLQHLAASVTAYGRKQILFAKDVIETFYGGGADPRCDVRCEAKTVYGDSVTGDTPVFVRGYSGDENPRVRRIDELFAADDVRWGQHHDTKDAIDMSAMGICVWTDSGFTPIKRLIRHRLHPTKKLYRILTHSGAVDATEDHSLVLADGTECRPGDVTLGTELLHNHDQAAELGGCEAVGINENIAFMMGLFLADGSVYPRSAYLSLIYNEHGQTKVPDIILNAPLNILNAFWKGFQSSGLSMRGDNKELLHGLYLVKSRLGLDTERRTAIKKIIELPHPGEDVYVYDFETENHHFAVGPGALVVHNTDSLFVQFNPRDPVTGEALKGREARLAVIELTAEAGHLVTKALKPPHDFEFDKVFDPILLFSKKRYAGKMFENADKPDDFVYKYMGIALKRRDNAPIVKTIYGAAMKKVLDEKDVAGAAEIVRRGCTDLVEGRIPLTQLTITKSLRAESSNPDSVAHKVLAERMAVRDPGNAPAAGDRIPFVYVRPAPGREASKLQGDRIETPGFIRENKLQPDYGFYIEHQLSSPIGQMFALLLESMPDYSPSMLPRGFADMPAEGKMAVRERIAYDLLFKPAISVENRMKERAAAAAMFGLKAVTGPITQKVVASVIAPKRGAATAPTGGKQMTIDSYFADAALLKIRKKNASAAAAGQAQAQAQTHKEINA